MQPSTERPNPQNRGNNFQPQPDSGGSKKFGGIDVKLIIIMVAIALGVSYLLGTLLQYLYLNSILMV